MDIVYVLGTNSGWKDEELRYSLRSVEKFLTHYGNVFIVGECPSWVRNVLHLPWQDTLNRKEYSIMSKIKHACEQDFISKEFLYMADDYYFINQRRADGFVPTYGTTLKSALHGKVGKNAEKIRNLIDLYPEGLFFDMHQPFPIIRKKFIEAMNKLDWKNKDYSVKSAYIAASGFRGYSPYLVNDTKIKGEMDYDKLANYIRIINECWFSSGPASLNDHFKRLLFNLFPNKSKFEL